MPPRELRGTELGHCASPAERGEKPSRTSEATEPDSLSIGVLPATPGGGGKRAKGERIAEETAWPSCR